MKRIYYAALAVALTFTACKQDDGLTLTVNGVSPQKKSLEELPEWNRKQYLLLRDTALLIPRFNPSMNPAPYIEKAYQVCEAQQPADAYQWLLTAWFMNRLAYDSGCLPVDKVHDYLNHVLEETCGVFDNPYQQPAARFPFFLQSQLPVRPAGCRAYAAVCRGIRQAGRGRKTGQ